jgi:hypothetical protein
MVTTHIYTYMDMLDTQVYAYVWLTLFSALT